METYHLKPKPGELEAIQRRIDEVLVWWVEFDEPVERVWCERQYCPVVFNADYGITWAGVDTRHYPRQVPTDRDGVCCIEFGVPITLMALEERFMEGWMHVVRSNGIHGHYRKAGTEREYRF